MSLTGYMEPHAHARFMRSSACQDCQHKHVHTYYALEHKVCETLIVVAARPIYRLVSLNVHQCVCCLRMYANVYIAL